MRVYLDNCCLQRPLDTKSQPRILLEAEAILVVLDLVESGLLEIVSSEALAFEIGRSPIAARRNFALELLSRSTLHVGAQEQVVDMAQAFTAKGIKPMDALHLASAIEAKADFFCTCDHALLRKAKNLAPATIQVLSPLELIVEIEHAPSAKTSE